MKPRIGDLEVYENFSLLVPEGQSATVPLLIDGWNLLVDIVFERTTTESEATADISGMGPNRALLKLKNWTSPLGTSLNTPIFLGKTGLKSLNIYFLIVHWKIGKVDKLELQIMVGGPDA